VDQPAHVRPTHRLLFSSSLTKQDFEASYIYNNQHRRQELARQANPTSKSGGTIANIYRFNYIESNPIAIWS
jgi:hypothetical protein